MKKKRAPNLTVQVPASSWPLWHHGLLAGALLIQLTLLWAFSEDYPASTALMATTLLLKSLQLPTAAAFTYWLKGTSAWLLLCGACLTIGTLTLRVIKNEGLDALERSALGLLLGATVLGNLTFALGLAGAYKPQIFWFICLATVSVGIAWLIKERGAPAQAFVADFDAYAAANPSPILHVLLCVILALPFFMAFVPELFYDALVYHLGLPHLYITEGRYVDTPYVHFSKFPQLVHMLYTFALGLSGEHVAKLCHVLLLYISVALIYAIGRRLRIPKAGVYASLLCASIPVIQMNTWTTAVDMAMSAFAIGSLLCAIIWHQSEQPDWKALALSGILAGATFATKYTGAFFLFGMMGFITYSCIQRRLSIKTMFISLLLWGGLVTALILPWFIRNWRFTGNPFYPFLTKIFESKNFVPEKFASAAEISGGFNPYTFWEHLTFPWQMALRGPSAFDFFGPAVIAFLPYGLALRLPAKTERPWIAFFIIFFASGFWVSRQVRYLLPGFCILAIFAGCGLAAIAAQKEFKKWSWALNAYLLVAMLYLIGWNLTIVHTSYSPAAVLSGTESREQYNSYYHPGMNPWPPQNIFEDIAKLPADARVVFLGDEKVFRCPRPFVFSNVYDKTPLVELANTSASPDALYAAVKDQGLTHIMFNV
ncbi:MAG: glycosyltransferase family 39 protein, partial [Elusimicrobiota bacterium]